MLRLLHLSDIHFSDWLASTPGVDLERSVRDRMLADMSVTLSDLGQVDGILVVGDIANRGKRQEYVIAREFLDEAARLTRCPPDRIVCVPGNHDVDRSKQTAAHKALRESLRSTATGAVSDTLLALLNDEYSGPCLLAPFEAYNEFALAYGCDFSSHNVVFAPKSFDLGAGKTAEVHGINSSWVCDGSETALHDEQALVTGLFQYAAIGNKSDTVSISLSHHPANWVRDAAEIAPWSAQAHLVLTGHEHEAGISLSADGRTLYVASGALNPTRDIEKWIPAYNIIELEMDSAATETLTVTVYSRTWQFDHAEFGPDTGRTTPFRCQIPLSRASISQPAAPSTEVTQSSGPDEPNVAVVVSPPSPAAQPITSANHSNAHIVMTAAPDKRHSAARAMGLVSGDPKLTGLDLDRYILRAALDQDVLPALAAELVGA